MFFYNYILYSSLIENNFNVYIIDSNSIIIQDITPSLKKLSKTDIFGYSYDFGEEISSPTILIELLFDPINLDNFFYESQATSIIFDENFNTEKAINMSHMFYNCAKLKTLNISSFNINNVVDISYMFKGCTNLLSLNLQNFNTSNITDMSWLFKECRSLTEINITHFDTQKAKNIQGMFDSCSSLKSIDLSNFNTSNVLSLRSLFFNCSSITYINLNNFDTKKVTEMHSMFSLCTNLKYIDINNFDTNSVTTMYAMFMGCKSLIEINIGNFKTNNVMGMGSMFGGCSSLKSLDISNFEIIDGTIVEGIFDGTDELEYCKYNEYNSILKYCKKAMEIKNCYFCENLNLTEIYCNKTFEDNVYQFRYLKNETNITDTRKCFWFSDEKDYDSLYPTEKNDTIIINSTENISLLNDCIDIYELYLNNSNNESSKFYIYFNKIDINENIKINITYLKIINNICLLNFDILTSNLKNIYKIYNQLAPSEKILISFYSISESPNFEKLIYKNSTFLSFETCNISHDQNPVFIIGYDTKNKYSNMAINNFTYEFYFENGTEIKNYFEICNTTKVKMSSEMNDLNLVLYEEAVIFASQGYDIYNQNDDFYSDYCCPAYINNNDVTLKDRNEDFLLKNISICNKNCEYDYTNLTEKRFICTCDIINTNNSNNNSDINNEEKISYSEFFLSFMNYRIITCYDLLLNKKNLINNIGFYFGIVDTGSCFILSIFFIIFGIKKLKNDVYNNIPTSTKLEKLLSAQKKKARKNNHNICNNKNNININLIKKHCPPKKHLENIKPYFLSKSPQNKTKLTLYNITNNFSTKRAINKYKNKGRKSCIGVQQNEFINNFNLDHLIIINDDQIEKKELNNVPYTQALRIDNRHYIQMALSVFNNEVDILNIIFLRNDFSHLSILISIYLMLLNFDIALNCYLYTDDYVSQKYHNYGKLKITTTILLSLFSNIISNLLKFIISKFSNYSEVLELIIKNVQYKDRYMILGLKLIKRTKLFAIFFFIFQLLLNLLITYYMIIFCAVFHKTQISMLKNYLVGVLESLIISLMNSFVFSTMRYLGLKCHLKKLYNMSHYLIFRF